MTFKLNNSLHKLYDYFLKHSIIINNRLNKIKIFDHYIFKNKMMKVIVLIIIFVLIFDKFTIFLVMGIIYGFESYQNSHKNKNTENYNNFLSSKSVEHYYDNITELSKIFKVLVFSIFHFITELLLIAIGSLLNKKKEVLRVVNHILNNESIIIIKI